jgi:hypothetical protein
MKKSILICPGSIYRKTNPIKRLGNPVLRKFWKPSKVFQNFKQKTQKQLSRELQDWISSNNCLVELHLK